MRCCSKKTKNLKLLNESTQLNLLLQKFPRFARAELVDYKQRFERMCRGKYIGQNEFRENMGLLGLETTSLITDRIFKVIARRDPDRISLVEYLEYMDIVLHGTQEERATQSFKLIAQHNSQEITYSEFASWLISVWKMYNALTGAEVSASGDLIRLYFDQLDLQKDGVIDLEEYKSALKHHDYIFEWFDYLTKGIAENLNAPVHHEEKEKLSYEEVLEELESEIACVLKLLTGIDVDAGRASGRKSEIRVADISVVVSEDSCSSNSSRGCKQPSSQLQGDVDYPVDSDSVEEERFIVRADSFLDQERTYAKVTLARTKLESLLEKLRTYKEKKFCENDLYWNKTIMPNKEKKNQAIYWGDSEWKMILQMMLGIQKAVKAAVANFREHSEVNAQEFTEIAKYNLIPGNATILDQKVKFRDYSPQIFQRIRSFSEIKSNDYIHSLGVEKIIHSLVLHEFSTLEGQCSAGKSGSFFYFSDDGKYMLKTLSKREFEFLIKILPDYYTHLFKNPHSMLSRIYGVHRMVLSRKKFLNFIVMGNVFDKGLVLHEIYDLKGSSQGRNTAPTADASVPRKDLDFLEREVAISIGPEAKKYVTAQIEHDCEFLDRLKIIDYSLLVGIHHSNEPLQVPKYKKNVKFTEKDYGGLMSVERKEIYCLGIIDILTEYGTKKKFEHFFKGILHDNNSISCAPPRFYSTRFKNFLNAAIK